MGMETRTVQHVESCSTDYGIQPFCSHLSISLNYTNNPYSSVSSLVQYKNLRPQPTWTLRVTPTIYQTAEPLKSAFA